MPFFIYYQELNNDIIQSWQKQKSSHAWPAGTQNVATTSGERSWRQGFESRCACSALGALPRGESVLQKSREPHIYNQVSLGALRW